MASVEQQVQISPEELLNSVAKEDATLGVRRYFTIAGRDPFGEALDKLNPGAANSFPVPLLILGGLAILLVLAGLAGLGVRRYQARGDSA